MSNIVAPGTSSTPPTMTRPGSPPAWRSTAWIVGPRRSGVATVALGRFHVKQPNGGRWLPAALRVGQRALDVAPRVALGDVATTVVQLLAAREPQLQLGPALGVEVQPERHDRQALRLRPPEQLVDLRAVQQQLPDPLRLVVEAVRLLERGDVGADEPGLVALDPGIGVRQVDLAGADAT